MLKIVCFVPIKQGREEEGEKAQERMCMPFVL
jgi:hypothetical protein